MRHFLLREGVPTSPVVGTEEQKARFRTVKFLTLLAERWRLSNTATVFQPESHSDYCVSWRPPWLKIIWWHLQWSMETLREGASVLGSLRATDNSNCYKGTRRNHLAGKLLHYLGVLLTQQQLLTCRQRRQSFIFSSLGLHAVQSFSHKLPPRDYGMIHGLRLLYETS